MDEASPVVIFTLDERQFGLPLGTVERVVHMVEITSVPQAPALVRGIINFHGQTIAVYDLRERLGLPPREPEVSDLLLIAHTKSLTVALLINNVLGVEEVEPQTVAAPTPGILHGVTRSHETLLLIDDLEWLLPGVEASHV